VIRAALPADAPAIAALHAASWRSAYRGALPDSYLDGPIEAERLAVWQARLAALGRGDAVLVAPGANGLRGFAAAFARPDGDALLDNLHVAPALRGRGLGLVLLAGIAARLYRTGSVAMHLWVFDVNASARRFYVRHGATETGHRVERMFGADVPETRLSFGHLGALAAQARR
jgi:GNAT superfamily N-acetyltransferase